MQENEKAWRGTGLEIPEGLQIYYVGNLKCGQNATAQIAPEVMEVQKRHQAIIHMLHKAGRLLLANPFTDGSDLRSLFFLTTESLEEAEALAAEDPAGKAGRMTFDMYPWLRPKGITFARR